MTSHSMSPQAFLPHCKRTLNRLGAPRRVIEFGPETLAR